MSIPMAAFRLRANGPARLQRSLDFERRYGPPCRRWRRRVGRRWRRRVRRKHYRGRSGVPSFGEEGSLDIVRIQMRRSIGETGYFRAVINRILKPTQGRHDQIFGSCPGVVPTLHLYIKGEWVIIELQQRRRHFPPCSVFLVIICGSVAGCGAGTRAILSAANQHVLGELRLQRTIRLILIDVLHGWDQENRLGIARPSKRAIISNSYCFLCVVTQSIINLVP